MLAVGQWTSMVEEMVVRELVVGEIVVVAVEAVVLLWPLPPVYRSWDMPMAGRVLPSVKFPLPRTWRAPIRPRKKAKQRPSWFLLADTDN